MSDEFRTYRKNTGRILADADIEALAAEAEHGYDVDRLAKKPGRPRMGSAPAAVVPVRLHANLHDVVKAFAEAERTSLSEGRPGRSAGVPGGAAATGALRTASKHVLGDTDLRALADQAEAGYDVTSLRNRPSRRAGEQSRGGPCSDAAGGKGGGRGSGGGRIEVGERDRARCSARQPRRWRRWRPTWRRTPTSQSPRTHGG